MKKIILLMVIIMLLSISLLTCFLTIPKVGAEERSIEYEYLSGNAFDLFPRDNSYDGNTTMFFYNKVDVTGLRDVIFNINFGDYQGSVVFSLVFYQNSNTYRALSYSTPISAIGDFSFNVRNLLNMGANSIDTMTMRFFVQFPYSEPSTALMYFDKVSFTFNAAFHSGYCDNAHPIFNIDNPTLPPDHNCNESCTHDKNHICPDPPPHECPYPANHNCNESCTHDKNHICPEPPPHECPLVPDYDLSIDYFIPEYDIKESAQILFILPIQKYVSYKINIPNFLPNYFDFLYLGFVSQSSYSQFTSSQTFICDYDFYSEFSPGSNFNIIHSEVGYLVLYAPYNRGESSLPVNEIIPKSTIETISLTADIFNIDYDYIYEDAFQSGKDLGLSEGYNKGFDDATQSWGDMFPSFFGGIADFFKNLLDIKIWNTSLLAILGGVGVIILALVVIRMVVK